MPTFRHVSEQAAAGCILKPILINFFLSDEPFRIRVDVQRSVGRPPDGWFHASTHPTMGARDLYQYLVRPETVQREKMGFPGKMGTMFGTIYGDLIRQACQILKISVPVPRGTCRACGLPQPSECKEHGACDEATLSRGHLDGILHVSGAYYGNEIKTIRSLGLSKVPDMDVDYFRKHWPYYYYQVMEYMRLTGLRTFIVLFMSMGSPWEFREFHVPYDPAVALEIENKYLRVIRARDSGVPIIV